MKKLIFSLIMFNTSAFANLFAEISEQEIIPAKDGFYSCYLYDDKARFVSSVGWQYLNFDKQYFSQKSKKGLFEMGNNEIWQAIYQAKNARLIFQRTSKAYRNGNNTEIFTTKMTYTKGGKRTYVGEFKVECGA